MGALLIDDNDNDDGDGYCDMADVSAISIGFEGGIGDRDLIGQVRGNITGPSNPDDRDHLWHMDVDRSNTRTTAVYMCLSDNDSDDDNDSVIPDFIRV